MKNELDKLVDQISKVKFASNNLVLLESSDREKCLKIISEELKNKSSEIMDINSKEIIHEYGPKKKVIIMPIIETIKRIEKTANLKVKKICRI